MPAEHTIDLSAEVPVQDASGPVKATLSMKTNACNIGLMIDKHHTRRTVDKESDGVVRVHSEAFNYADATEFYMKTGLHDGPDGLTAALSADDASATARDTLSGQEPAATGLEDRVREFFDEGKDALRKTKVTASTGVEDGKRNVCLSIDYEDNKVFDFKADDINSLDDIDDLASPPPDPSATSLEDGAETISDNAMESARGRRLVASWRATDGGQNENDSDSVNNTIVQSKGGVFVISAADVLTNLYADIGAEILVET